ncbi:insulinase family protein [Streptomyces sp. NPDC048606]|uniref:M16 family metallopeptidase n=1 Tax=Streptomyces sp. NPDC048606 TaxID=3154726 RepID=UPI003423DB4A
MNRTTSDTLLGNGLRVLAVRAPGAPLAEVRLVLPYARTAPDRLAGARELLAACLGTGTTASASGASGGTRQDIADRAADLGAELSTVVTAESLVIATSVLRPGLPGALALLSDLLLRPAYREEELALALRRAGAAPRTPGPRSRLHRALLGHAFGEHPLLSPPPVPRASTDDLYALHARAVVPAGAVLLVMSADEPDAVCALVRERLEGWSGGPSGLVAPPFARSTPRPGRLAASAVPAGSDDPGQALVLCAGPAVAADDPAHVPLHLAHTVLGAAASSRLVRRIRDRHGLAYAVSAEPRGNRAGDWLEIEAAGAPGTADRIAGEIVGVLRELADRGPSPEEVERARAHAIGFTRFALATRTEEASALAGFAAAGLPLDWLATHRERLAEVTPDQVAKAAARHLDPDLFLVATLDTGANTDTGAAAAAAADSDESPAEAPDEIPSPAQESDRWTP